MTHASLIENNLLMLLFWLMIDLLLLKRQQVRLRFLDHLSQTPCRVGLQTVTYPKELISRSPLQEGPPTTDGQTQSLICKLHHELHKEREGNIAWALQLGTPRSSRGSPGSMPPSTHFLFHQLSLATWLTLSRGWRLFGLVLLTLTSWVWRIQLHLLQNVFAEAEGLSWSGIWHWCPHST